MVNKDPVVLPGVLEWFDERSEFCDVVILTTARPEDEREKTVKQLEKAGITYYHQLVMGLTAGPRTIINDTKPNMAITCSAITVERDGGLKKLLEKFA